MATNSPGATGSRERRFRNILGASWELGAWEFIAQNGLLGGHLGNQNHWPARVGMGRGQEESFAQDIHRSIPNMARDESHNSATPI